MPVVDQRMLTLTLLPEMRKLQLAFGSTLQDLLKQIDYKSKFPVIAGKVNNKIYDLDKPLQEEATVEFVDQSSRDGMLAYQRSLFFILVRAVRELYPDVKVCINHSLSRGFYCELHNVNLQPRELLILTEEDLLKIEKRMREIVEDDEPFVREEMSREDAMRYFEEQGMNDKVRLLQYRKDAKVSLYSCGPIRNHFYGILAPRTGLIRLFKLKLYPPGFILRLPTVEEPHHVPPFIRQEKMFQVFQEYERWGNILGIENVANLDDVITQGGILELILIAESLHEKRIAQIADQFTSHKTHPRVIMISGPTSSGKTTFSKRLTIQLRVNGWRPFLISLDDYFVDREQTPRDERGEFDFEAFGAIDAQLFINNLRSLLRGDEVVMPRFNFKMGRSAKGPKVCLNPDQIIIVEGIHALNTELTKPIPEGLKFKVYVSALTQLNIDEHNRVSTSDVRLIRRLVRDHCYRGYKADETLGRWDSVRRGEERNIFPYQENAHVIFNSALIYELGVLKTFAEPLLEEITRDIPSYSEARRLLKFLSYFLPIDHNQIPPTSILREFLGGSCFMY